MRAHYLAAVVILGALILSVLGITGVLAYALWLVFKFLFWLIVFAVN